MKFLAISLLSICSLFFYRVEKVVENQPKTEGVVTYEYQGFGASQIDCYLYFNNDRARYKRHQEKNEITSDNGYLYEYPQDYKDWYYQKDSLYLFTDKEGYPNFFANWEKEPMKWEITDETQIIQGYKVTKAITTSLYYAIEQPGVSKTDFGKAVAWFTTEVPINYGPDGYYGLPGLIVKLEYTGLEGSLTTTLKNIEYKKIEDWQLPSTKDKLQVDKDQAYNYWNYGKKWFKQQAKKAGL